MPTQLEIAKQISRAQQATDHMRRGIYPRDCTIDQARLGYIEHLREMAAGRGGDDQFNLTLERARQARADAQLKEFELATRAGELVPAADAKALMAGWAASGRQEMEDAWDKAIQKIESYHQITIDRADLDDVLEAAFSAIADYPRFHTFSDSEANSDNAATSRFS